MENQLQPPALRLRDRRVRAVSVKPGSDKTRAHLFVWVVLAIAIAPYPLYEKISPWVGVGLFFFGMALVRFTLALKNRVAYVEFMLIYYFVVFFLTSLALYYLDPQQDYAMDARFYPDYLAYAIPCCVAVYVGCVVATRGLPPLPFAAAPTQNVPPWARFARLFVIAGLGFTLVTFVFPSGSALTYPLILMGYLRWVGVFTLILSGQRGWWSYAAVVLAEEVLVAGWQGMFGDAIIWSACAFAVVGYRFRWRWKAVALMLVAVALLLILQSIKHEYRTTLSGETGIEATTDQVSSFAELFASRVSEPSYLLNPRHLADTLTRFNQGWIVERVMKFVPLREPFAGGATLQDDLIAVLLPRAFAPDKATAGGRELFLKYTGLRLNERTAMNISPVSEMYVNFGSWLGVVGMLFYGLAIGGLYRWLALKAAHHPVWWAWGPFVGLWSLKADEDLINIFNGIFKALIVLSVILWFTNRRPSRPTVRLS